MKKIKEGFNWTCLIMNIALILFVISVKGYAIENNFEKQKIRDSLKKWSIEFNQIIDESKESILKDSLVEILDASGNPHYVDYVVENNIIKIIPKKPYINDEEYIIRISEDIKSTMNKKLNKEVQKKFKYLGENLSVKEDDSYKNLKGEPISISGNISFESPIKKDTNFIIRASYMEAKGGG